MVPQLQSVQQKARGGNISIQLIAKLESKKFEKLWNPLFAKLENPMLVSTHSDQWNHHHHRDCSRVARLLHLLSLGSDADADVAARELYCDGGRLHCENSLQSEKAIGSKIMLLSWQCRKSSRDYANLAGVEENKSCAIAREKRLSWEDFTEKIFCNNTKHRQGSNWVVLGQSN